MKTNAHKSLFNCATLVFLSAIVLSNSSVQGATITIQQGVNGGVAPGTRLVDGSGTSDTRFGITDEQRSIIVLGFHSSGFIDRGVMRFDLSSHSGETVTGDGTLTLTIHSDENYGNRTVDLYQIDSTNAGWNQNFASWNNYDQTVPTAWAGGAGLGSPGGGGYGASPISTVTQATYTAGTTISLVIPQAVLQSWIDTPSTNAGVMLHSDNEALAGRLFFWGNGAGGVSAPGNIGDRPLLTFDTVPEPSAAGLLVTGGLFALARSRSVRRSVKAARI